MNDIIDITTKSEFEKQIHSIRDKLASETPLSKGEHLTLLASELLKKTTRRKQNYADE